MPLVLSEFSVESSEETGSRTPAAHRASRGTAGHDSSPAGVSEWRTQQGCRGNRRTPDGSLFGRGSDRSQFAVSEAESFMKIDHIGIAVKSLAEAAKVYEQALGLK